MLELGKSNLFCILYLPAHVDVFNLSITHKFFKAFFLSNATCFPAIQFSNRRRDEGDEMAGRKGRKFRSDGHLYGHHSKNKDSISYSK